MYEDDFADVIDAARELDLKLSGYYLQLSEILHPIVPERKYTRMEDVGTPGFMQETLELIQFTKDKLAGRDPVQDEIDAALGIPLTTPQQRIHWEVVLEEIRDDLLNITHLFFVLVSGSRHVTGPYDKDLGRYGRITFNSDDLLAFFTPETLFRHPDAMVPEVVEIPSVIGTLREFAAEHNELLRSLIAGRQEQWDAKEKWLAEERIKDTTRAVANILYPDVRTRPDEAQLQQEVDQWLSNHSDFNLNDHQHGKRY